MATMQDLHELALALPETTGGTSADGRPEYEVRGRTFCRHREPRKDAVDPASGERLDDVLMFVLPDLDLKAALLERRPDVYFTTDHFNNYAAVLIRIPSLALLSRDDLDDLLVEGWLSRAPKRLAKAWLAEQEAAGETP